MSNPNGNNDSASYFDRGVSSIAPVRTIDNNGTPLRISAEDFDPQKHTEWTGDIAPAGSVPSRPIEKLPDGLNVASEGSGKSKRFYVTDRDGNRYDDPRFTADGYTTDIDAWAAIDAAQKQQAAG